MRPRRLLLGEALAAEGGGSVPKGRSKSAELTGLRPPARFGGAEL